MERPHLFILGAGASLAAFPNGDADGRMLPLMNNLIEIVGLEETLSKHGYKSRHTNFEDLFSELFAENPHSELLIEIEENVAEYFRSLALPEKPTIYDYLVLSLRPKDVIATFNWDPFLFQALERNHQFTKGPHYYFLHGCAALGWCEKDKKQGRIGTTCPICGNRYKPTQLLYPIKEKDYNCDNYIASQWKNLQGALRQAFTFTIFGYRAPTSDVEAISLLREAWGPPETRNLEESEFIDIIDEDILLERWTKFIHSHHYRYNRDFFKSFVARHPRRTCEVYWKGYMEIQFWEENPVPRVESLQQLWQWYEGLLEYEKESV
ncbi:MAG: hypothetical protein QQN41_02535 [Nitrosopumilus sp.]